MQDFSSYPTDHVVGLVAAPQQVAAAVEDLHRIFERTITTLCGKRGRERLDASGARGGLLGRVVRVVQRIGPEHEHLARYATALDEGAALIAVRSGPQGKRDAADILAAHGARDVNFYGRHTIESLDDTARDKPPLPSVTNLSEAAEALPSVTNLSEAAEALLNQARASRAGRAGRTLTPGPGIPLKQTLLALIEGRSLADHESPAAATLQVLAGAVRLTGSAGTVDLEAGDHVLLPSARHGLDALDDAAMLLTVTQKPPAVPDHG